MLLLLAELATPDQDAPRGCLNRCPVCFFPPLNKRAIAEADSPLPADSRNLIAWPPECAVAYAHNPFVCWAHFNHGGIVTTERSEFGVGDQQSILCGLLDQDGAVAVIRTDSQEIAVTFPCP